MVVTKTIPWPANSGEKQRTLGMVRALATRGMVTVVGFAGPHEDAALAEADGVRVVAVGRDTGTGALRLGSRALRLGARAVRHRSITTAKCSDPRLTRAVSDIVRQGADVVVVEHVQMAASLPARLPASTVTVLDMHNVESLLTRRLARTTRGWRRLPVALEARLLARTEQRAVPGFDLVAVVSDADRRALAEVVPHPDVVVLPNALDADDEPLPPAPTPTALFVGLMSWAPNADAAVAFADSVWPAVRHAVPGSRLLLVGREPTREVRALACADVVVTGTVADVMPSYAEARVALAPLAAGGGSRLKILEALAWGRPVVASAVGAEGLEDLHGRGVVVADDPSTMAHELSRLLSDPVGCAELGSVGAAAVRADHSWPTATRDLLERLEAMTDAR